MLESRTRGGRMEGTVILLIQLKLSLHALYSDDTSSNPAYKEIVFSLTDIKRAGIVQLFALTSRPDGLDAVLGRLGGDDVWVVDVPFARAVHVDHDRNL